METDLHTGELYVSKGVTSSLPKRAVVVNRNWPEFLFPLSMPLLEVGVKGL